jgi:hypothetical protein
VNSKTQSGGRDSVRTATARITFAAPGKIHIAGKDTAGHAYVIISDGNETWSSWAIKNKGAFEKARSVENAVAAKTGVAAQAPTTIPAALMHLNWGNPFARGRGGQVVGHEKIGGSDCYKVVADAATGKTTYWVDSKTFLLRQLKEEQDAKQLAQMHQRIQESLKQAGRPALSNTSTSTSREVVQSFAIEAINRPVDAKLFQKPAGVVE